MIYNSGSTDSVQIRIATHLLHAETHGGFQQQQVAETKNLIFKRELIWDFSNL